MDVHSELSGQPNSREDQQYCEEKQIPGISNVDRTLKDFTQLQTDESLRPSASGKIYRICKKMQKESKDLHASKKSWSDAQYSPYKVEKKRESERSSTSSQLQDSELPVPITDKEISDWKVESSAVGRVIGEGGTAKSPETSELEISNTYTESVTCDDRRKDRKRKSDQETRGNSGDLEEVQSTSEKVSDNEDGSCEHKRRKSDKDHVTQEPDIKNSRELEASSKISPTVECVTDGSNNYLIKKNILDEPLTMMIPARKDAPSQTLGQKISSTIDQEIGISSISDLATPSTSGESSLTLECAKDSRRDNSAKENVLGEPVAKQINTIREVPAQILEQQIFSVINRIENISNPAQPNTSGKKQLLGKTLSASEKLVLADTKKTFERLHPKAILKLSDKDNEMFDEQKLDLTLTIINCAFKKYIKTFYAQHLTSANEPRSLLSNARKLEDSLLSIKKILCEIPKLHLQQNDTSGEVKSFWDVIMHLRRGHSAVTGRPFDINKVDRIPLMITYNNYFHKWASLLNEYEDRGDDVYKRMEELKTTVKEAIRKCKEGYEFIHKLKTSKFLMDVAVLQRSHQIGEDITLPPRVNPSASEYKLEKVKEGYLNPIPCTDALHDLHTHRNVYCYETYHTCVDISDSSSALYSSESMSEDLDDIEKESREFLQKDSVKNKAASSEGLPIEVLNPENLQCLQEQLLRSKDAHQKSRDPSYQHTPTTRSIDIPQSSTDITTQTFSQLIPPRTSGIEKNLTDTAFQPTHFGGLKRSTTNTDSPTLMRLLLETPITVENRPANSDCKPSQPLSFKDASHSLTDPNCQIPITTNDEKIKSSNSSKFIEMRQEPQECEVYVSGSKDKLNDNISLLKEAGEQKIATNNQESNPTTISKDSLCDSSPPNQITSTPIKSAGDEELMDCNNSEIYQEDSACEDESTGDIHSSESDYLVCNKSMEIDELNDQLCLIGMEIVEFTKSLSSLLNKAKVATYLVIDSKNKITSNLNQFLRGEIPGLIKKI